MLMGDEVPQEENLLKKMLFMLILMRNKLSKQLTNKKHTI
jgi:hypothetical protein